MRESTFPPAVATFPPAVATFPPAFKKQKLIEFLHENFQQKIKENDIRHRRKDLSIFLPMTAIAILLIEAYHVPS